MSKTFSNNSSRQASIELLRFVSCMGVVWFHSKAPGGVVGYAGLPALVALSAGLASAPGKLAPFHVTVAKRAKRLLIPWAFWCLVYGAERAAKSIIQSKPFLENGSWWMLSIGPAIHLWYLPFAFVMTCLVSLFQSTFCPSEGASKTAISLIGVAVLMPICSYLLQVYSWPAPVPNWIFSIPAVFIGLALPHMSNTRQSVINIIGLILIVAFIGFWDLWIGLSTLGIPYFIGTVCLIIAWFFPLPPNRYIEWMGQASFGVYLIHQLIFQIASRITHQPGSAVNASVVILLSVGIVAIMRRGFFQFVM